MTDKHANGPWKKFKLIFGSRRNHDSKTIDKSIDKYEDTKLKVLDGVIDEQYDVLDFQAFKSQLQTLARKSKT